MPTLDEIKRKSDLPVVIANHQGLIVYINHQFERVFGWTAEEIVGQMLTVLMPVYFRDGHDMSFSRFNATGQSDVLNHPLKLKALSKDGQEIMSEHFIVAESHEGQWLFGAILRPLDAR